MGRRTSDFSLDDLLGLSADPAPSAGSESAAPYSDPFQVNLAPAEGDRACESSAFQSVHSVHICARYSCIPNLMAIFLYQESC